MAFNATTASTVVTTRDTIVSTNNVSTNNVSTNNVSTNNVSTNNVSTNNVINPTLYDRWMLPL
jgi:hypothetical protein